MEHQSQKVAEDHGTVQNITEHHGRSWNITHRGWRNIMEQHGRWRNIMEQHGRWQNIMEHHRMSWNITHRRWRNSVEQCGTSWNITEGHGTLLTEPHGRSWKHGCAVETSRTLWKSGSGTFYHFLEDSMVAKKSNLGASAGGGKRYIYRPFLSLPPPCPLLLFPCVHPPVCACLKNPSLGRLMCCKMTGAVS
jgi:hypothetical protein